MHELIPDPTLDTLNRALENISHVGGLDYGYLANARPDIDIIQALWKNTTYQVTDRDRWPTEIQKYLITPSTKTIVLDLSDEDPAHHDGKVFFLPNSGAWFVLEEHDNGYAYLSLRIGMTQDQYGMYVMPYATEKFSTASKEDLKLWGAEYRLMEYVGSLDIWNAVYSIDNGTLIISTPSSDTKLPSEWEGYSVVIRKPSKDDWL